MIREFELENFKAFGRAQKARMAPLTLIYGPNSGGKSSIIQGLLLYAQTIDSGREGLPLVMQGPKVDLGSFQSLVYDHDVRRCLRLGVTCNPRARALWRHAETVFDEEHDLPVQDWRLSDEVLSDDDEQDRQSKDKLSAIDLDTSLDQSGVDNRFLSNHANDLKNSAISEIWYRLLLPCALTLEYSGYRLPGDPDAAVPSYRATGISLGQTTTGQRLRFVNTEPGCWLLDESAQVVSGLRNVVRASLLPCLEVPGCIAHRTRRLIDLLCWCYDCPSPDRQQVCSADEHYLARMLKDLCTWSSAISAEIRSLGNTNIVKHIFVYTGSLCDLRCWEVFGLGWGQLSAAWRLLGINGGWSSEEEYADRLAAWASELLESKQLVLARLESLNAMRLDGDVSIVDNLMCADVDMEQTNYWDMNEQGREELRALFEWAAAFVSSGSGDGDDRRAHLIHLVDLLDNSPLERAIERASTALPSGLCLRLEKTRDLLLSPSLEHPKLAEADDSDPAPSAAKEWVRDLESWIMAVLASIVIDMAHIGPYRLPLGRLPMGAPRWPGTVGEDGGGTLPLLLALRQVGSDEAGQDGLQRIDEALSRLGLPYRLHQVRLESADLGAHFIPCLHDVKARRTLSFADVGFGVGQVLPILVEAELGEAKEVCVEQPEIHLHPRQQAALADVLIDNYRHHGKQWILETHSEAMMLRIQRRIREGTLKASDVCVLYVKPGEEGSTIQELRLDDDGSFLDEWPDGFFEERFEDLFEV